MRAAAKWARRQLEGDDRMPRGGAGRWRWWDGGAAVGWWLDGGGSGGSARWRLQQR